MPVLSNFSSNLNFEMMALAVGKGDGFDCFIMFFSPKEVLEFTATKTKAADLLHSTSSKVTCSEVNAKFLRGAKNTK